MRRRRLAYPDVDLPEVSEPADPSPSMPESASAGAPTVPVVSAPVGLPAEILDGAGSPEAIGDASSQAVSQLILADVSAPRGEALSVLSGLLTPAIISWTNLFLWGPLALTQIILIPCLEQLSLHQIPICLELGLTLQILI